MKANNGLDVNREYLSQAIVEAVRSWPDSDRRIFVQAHYEGKSAEEISNSSGLRLKDVFQILRVCEWRLSMSLHGFYMPLPEIARRNSEPPAIHTPN
jgi:DNA-directed RNA polymerase specialized sigma24 family protein